MLLGNINNTSPFLSPPHGEIHFNDYEQWSTKGGDTEEDPAYVSLFYVAMHELGHALGKFFVRF